MPNALFVQAALDDIPAELDCLAEEVHIQFPWGSLLRAVAAGEQESLARLKRICRKDALLKVVLGLDPSRDRSEMERLKIPSITTDYITSVLIPSYENAGFKIVKARSIPITEYSSLKSSWAKRLQRFAGRQIFCLIARARK